MRGSLHKHLNYLQDVCLGESGSAAPHQSSRLPALSVSGTVTLDKLVNPSLRQLFHLYSGFDSEVQ